MWGKIWSYTKLVMTSLAFLLTWTMAMRAYPDKETAVRGMGLFTLITLGLFQHYLETNTLKYKWIVSVGSMCMVGWIIRWFFPS
ncbi:hypothetical protein B9G54_05675 [Alloscardovia macacae]|uniref:Uncharacterized protein n=1 Tax=Alloscardovia macacae TaxID=1160091 RepID=A0A1Y2SWN0_9BIFI|nr:hypothetical protein B9G54_05675 [Alloscardovia macacae]OTA29978.1 hypothetical protein B9T39_01015 [Alloscardovia macacae]